MADLGHDINVLASVAKIDKTVNEFRSELELIPRQIAVIDKKLAVLEKTRKNAIDRFEAMTKERRTLEQKLQDDEELITKYKGQLMSVKTNKEYQAMLKEIDSLEGDIDTREERLLALMDELDTRGEEHENQLRKITQEEIQSTKEKESLQTRVNFLESEIEKLEAEKPAQLKGISADLQRRYQRLLDNLGALPVARIEAGNCGGCHARQPVQLVHEVSKNDQIITCEGCGRILIHYSN